jgi:DNA-binding transcriptional ArsR family regulator
MVQLCRKLMIHIGLNPERLRIESLSAGEGIRFAEVMNEFSNTLKDLGPLGEGEGIDEGGLKFKLEAATKLVPYIRLVERERLRVRLGSVEKYNEFFASDEVNRLFQELIIDKLTISQIMSLLREKPRSTGELTEALGLTPSEVSRHLNNSTRQGLTRFDLDQKRYVAA